jgi:biopolymer transport protein ExbB/TolQ
MNKKLLPMVVLVITILSIHSLYVFWIIPEVQSLEQIASETGSILPRNFFVILKDFEQELCIILFIFAVYLCTEKLLNIASHSYLFDIDFLKNIEDAPSDALENLKLAEHLPEDNKSTPLDVSNTLETIEHLPEDIKSTPLVQIISLSLRRYAITGSIHDASEAIEPALDSMAIRNEGEIAVLKYITWAIPSIGFLGTVRGIGQAMTQAELAVAGNIGPMTSSLGLAFNSTFVALMISIVLMMLLSLLQSTQDDQLVRVQDYCERYLIRRISVVRH